MNVEVELGEPARMALQRQPPKAAKPRGYGAILTLKTHQSLVNNASSESSVSFLMECLPDLSNPTGILGCVR